jgi:chemotaxis protein histidine kinase CheA
MLDISELIHAEDEARHQRALVQVLKFRDSFERDILDFDATLARFLEGSEAELNQAAIRNALHTAKGVLSQFELTEQAELIHRLENQAQIGLESLSGLRRELRRLLDSNRSVWKIDLDDSEPKYETTESLLQEIEHDLTGASDVVELRALLRRRLAALRERPANDALGPVASATTRLAERRGKSVQLLIDGGQVRIPASHAAVIPTVVHLIRNAIDHGIELPEQRGSKPPVATLSISITRTPTLLCIEVADDGQGIDAERVARRALDLGLVDADTLATLSEAQKLRLVLLPGLSTATTVSETSGRGVGVGAVLEAVEAAGGSLEIRSERGRGTTFAIELPIVEPVPGSGVSPARRPPPASRASTA